MTENNTQISQKSQKLNDKDFLNELIKRLERWKLSE